MVVGKPVGSSGKSVARSGASRSAEAGEFVVPNAGKGRAKSLAGSDLAQSPSGLTRVVLKKAGGSLTMTVPAAARDALHLAVGMEMSVSVEGQRLVLEPMKPARPKYTIDELIAKCDLSAPYPDEAREWIDAPPVGRELL
jgi:antitoxin ChpS